MSEEKPMASIALDGQDYNRFLDADRQEGHRRQLAIKAGNIIENEVAVSDASKTENLSDEEMKKAFWAAWDKRYDAIRHKIGRGVVQIAQA